MCQQGGVIIVKHNDLWITTNAITMVKKESRCLVSGVFYGTKESAPSLSNAKQEKK